MSSLEEVNKKVSIKNNTDISDANLTFLGFQGRGIFRH